MITEFFLHTDGYSRCCQRRFWKARTNQICPSLESFEKDQLCPVSKVSRRISFVPRHCEWDMVLMELSAEGTSLNTPEETSIIQISVATKGRAFRVF